MRPARLHPTELARASPDELSGAVRAGDVIASVKVAPHLVPGAQIDAGALIAREQGQLISVRPYRA